MELEHNVRSLTPSWPGDLQYLTFDLTPVTPVSPSQSRSSRDSVEELTVDCLTGDDPDSVGILLPDLKLGEDGVVVTNEDFPDLAE